MRRRQKGYIYLLFKEPPGPDSGFIETENFRHESVSIGTWFKEGHYWVYEIPSLSKDYE